MLMWFDGANTSWNCVCTANQTEHCLTRHSHNATTRISSANLVSARVAKCYFLALRFVNGLSKMPLDCGIATCESGRRIHGLRNSGQGSLALANANMKHTLRAFNSEVGECKQKSQHP